MSNRPARSRCLALVVGVVAVGLISVSSCGASTSPSARLPPGANATVERVVDGDTIVARVGDRSEKVRMIGFNTPESVDPRKPVECYGPEASARLKLLLEPRTPVRLERDAESRDVYGRLLAYVFRTSDDMFVNLQMVRDGYAHVLTIAPNNTYADDFRSAERDARAAGRGLWSACPSTPG